MHISNCFIARKSPVPTECISNLVRFHSNSLSIIIIIIFFFFHFIYLIFGKILVDD